MLEYQKKCFRKLYFLYRYMYTYATKKLCFSALHYLLNNIRKKLYVVSVLHMNKTTLAVRKHKIFPDKWSYILPTILAGYQCYQSGIFLYTFLWEMSLLLVQMLLPAWINRESTANVEITFKLRIWWGNVNQGPVSISDQTFYCKSRSHEIGSLNHHIALKFDRHLGSNAVDVLSDIETGSGVYYD